MTPLELFNQIIEETPAARPGKMFGALCIKAQNGKAAAMFWKDNMVFKLTGEDEQEASSLDRTSTFNPMGTKPMNGWIQVPFDYSDKWKAYTESALAYVSTLK